MQLSKLENKAYELLVKNKLSVFKLRDISLLMNISKIKSYNLVKALKKKGAIESVKGGLFSIKGTDEFVIGANLNWPSYLSFWSALSYYGFSEQMPKTIFFASTKYHKEIKNFKYITLAKHRFFGYIAIGDIIIAEKEKAIIDSLLFPKYSGGMKEIKKSIEKALSEINLAKLIDYSIKIKSKVVIKRLGFLLEELKVKKSKIDKLQKSIKKGKGYESLDSIMPRKNNFNKKWMLDINW